MHSLNRKYISFGVSFIVCMHASHLFGSEEDSTVEQKPSVEILGDLIEVSPAECEQWPGCICVELDVVVHLPQRYSLKRICPHPVHEHLRLISTFDHNGQEIDRGQTKHGQAYGVWISWYPTGELNGIAEFADGKPHGSYTVWYPSGTLMYEGSNYNLGEHGDHFRYSESGNVEHHSVWEKGELLEDLSTAFMPLESDAENQR